MVNITKILEEHGVPGLCLYCPLYGTVEFKEIDKRNNIICSSVIESKDLVFNEEGRICIKYAKMLMPIPELFSTEVMLFPNKDCKEWNIFSEKYTKPIFKKGDRIISRISRNVAYKVQNIEDLHHYICINELTKETTKILLSNQDNFKLILKPKFEVGDLICKCPQDNLLCKVKKICLDYYELECGAGGFPLVFDDQDKYCLYQPKPKFNIGDKVLIKGESTNRYIVGIYDMGYTFLPVHSPIEFKNQNEIILVRKAQSFKVGDLICKKSVKTVNDYCVITDMNSHSALVIKSIENGLKPHSIDYKTLENDYMLYAKKREELLNLIN